MAQEPQDFRTLVATAAAAAPSPLTATGSLARAGDDEHFALAMADGRTVTLPIAAVTAHRELGGTVGGRLVEVTLDPEQIPEAQAAELRQGTVAAPKTPLVDRTGFEDQVVKHPWQDVTLAWSDHKHPWTDTTLFFADHKLPWTDLQTVPPGISAGPGPFEAAGAMPFVLAGPHQVDPQTLAAMNALPARVVRTGTHWDVVKPPFQDGVKRPIEDGTYPTPHGIHLDM